MSVEPAPSSGGRRSPRPFRLRGATLAALREGLSNDEWRQLEAEATEALAQAFRESPPDLQPFLDVIEAWYRTIFVRQDPGYEEAMANAGKSAEELGARVYTAEDLRRRLGL